MGPPNLAGWAFFVRNPQCSTRPDRRNRRSIIMERSEHSLSKKPIKPQPAPAAAPQSTPSPLLAFLNRRALPLALLFLAIASARIVSTYNVFATTGDEPAHIACGLEYVANHVYKLETQHPPLTRAMIA